jgi:NAD(P)-dependent dehydrogenase (short-subunit alcohol dehydrogenase family)
MTAPVLEKMHVLVTGVDAWVARDVARLVAGEGASVIAADRDGAKLSRLERDLGLFRTRIETAAVELGSQTEVRLWNESLAAFGRLPHLMICCCGSPGPHAPTTRRSERAALRAVQPDSVALSEARRHRCPATLAERVLQPTLFLHAEPTRRSAFDRALASLRHPTLRGLLERAPGRSVFSPEHAIGYVRIADQIYSMRRHSLGDTPPKGRIRLIPPDDAPPRQADAA